MNQQTGPRSLAAALRDASDAALQELFVLRPDLIHPVPADISQLAIRATTGPSVSRALDRLDAFTLQITQVIAALPDPTTLEEVASALPNVDDGAVNDAIASLRKRMLLWGPDDALHLVRVAREAFGLHPCGLGNSFSQSRRQVAAYAKKPSTLKKVLAEAPEEARSAVERLVWGPPVGTVPGADRVVTVETARSPIEWLLAREVLVASDRNTVMLPREVSLILRDGVMLRDITTTAPALTGTTRDATLLARTAGGNAFAFTRLVESLLDAWSLSPCAVLRGGGVGVRDFARTASALNVDEPTAAVVMEVAFAAGLVATNGEADEMWLPTSASDVWLSKSEADKWQVLAKAWLTMVRSPHVIGSDHNGKRINALSTEVERAQAPDIREAVLHVLADAEPTLSVNSESVVDLVNWRRPRRRSIARDDMVRATLREAELLGFTGLGSLSAAGRALAQGDDAKTALQPYLPALVDHVLVQADLSAVAPGPLTSEAAHLMSLLADVESTGAATVYRISDSSVRRALDAGMSSMEVIDSFTRLSKTELPQPLRYLVDDVARRHGSIRVGVASAYIRSDDETLIAALLADRKLAALRLMKLAPTVVATSASPDVVLERLRDAGLSPMAESADGVMVVRQASSRRAPSKRNVTTSADPVAPSEKLLKAAVRALRAGDQAASERPEQGHDIPRSSAAQTLQQLRDALEANDKVWIGYADPQGMATERVVEPLSIDGGFLTAFDTRSAEVRTFTVARITGVSKVTTSI